jgi:CRISPR-associated endonuclease Csn1
MELTKVGLDKWNFGIGTKKLINQIVNGLRSILIKRRENIFMKLKIGVKRYDNRHHAIDALVVALTEQSHIQRLNNLNKYLQDELAKRKDEFKLEVKEDETILEAFFNLEEKRREEIQRQIESSRYFEKPFEDLVNQAKTLLESMIVSSKNQKIN